MCHESAVTRGDRHVVVIEHDCALGGKLLQEEVHVVTLERVGCEVDVQLFNLVAIDSCVTLKVVVVGIECELFGAISCSDVSDAHDSLADVVLHRDLTALGSAPHNLHTGALAVKRI